jgi:hypothetical protein
VNPSTIRTTPVRCEGCHAGAVPPASPTHISGTADVQFQGRATTGGTAPAYAPATGCSATYCHGNYSGVYQYFVFDFGSGELIPVSVSYEGARATPQWTDGPMTCASCHGAPPAATGVWHTQFHGNGSAHRECQLCHPDASSVNGVPNAITNPALHVNGIVEVTPRFTSQCFGCH